MPDQFHHYTIIQELAKKYSHATYLAVPIDEPERRVVLIVFSSSLFSSAHEYEAVLEKAEALKALEHPYLVPILDLGIAEQQLFIVREYVPNQSLRSYLKQRTEQLQLQDTLAILLQIGEALVYAHSQKISHGNIKPENILLDADGQVRLADFALVERGAVMVRDQTTQEYAFCYLAPEQLVNTWNASVDQYAMGCLAYELITGEVPFVAESLTSLSSSIQSAPLSEKVPNLPPSLEVAVLKALAKDPSERFRELSFFLAVIRAVAHPQPAFLLLRSKDTDKQKSQEEDGDIPFILVKIEEGPKTISILVAKEEYSGAAFDLERDKIVEALPTSMNTMARQSLGRRIFFLAVILVSLAIAASAAYTNYFVRKVDNTVQSVDASTGLIQPSIPAGTQLVLPISSKTPLQFTTELQAKTTPLVSQSIPIPTPTPVSVPKRTTVDDHVQGTGRNQFNYIGGGWQHSSKKMCQGNPCEYNRGNSWDNTPNDDVTFTFTGTQLRFYGVLDPKHGIGAVSMDGRSETMINFYAAERAGNQLLWTSPVLPAGTHTFKLRVTGTKDSRSSNTFVTVDRVNIIS